MKTHRPTREELLAAEGSKVPDLVAPGLLVLFCGINPGLYSGAVRHHFARPGNRFWPALHGAGFTPQLLSPYDERELLQRGYGITNFVNRATATADKLLPEELREGGKRLRAKVRRYQPKYLAVLGVGAYRQAFAQPRAAIGPQEATVGTTRVWVLPNPSGLNANYQLPDLIDQFRELYAAAHQD